MSRVLLPVPPVYLGLPVLHLNRSCLAEALRDAIARAVAALLERPLRPEAASPFGMRLHVLHIPLPTHMHQCAVGLLAPSTLPWPQAHMKVPHLDLEAPPGSLSLGLTT